MFMGIQYYNAGNVGGMKYFSLEYERKRGEPDSFTCTIKARSGKTARQIGTVVIHTENSSELTQDFPVNDGSTLTFCLREGAMSLARNNQALTPIPTPLSVMERKHVSNAFTGGIILLLVGVFGTALTVASLSLTGGNNTLIYGTIAEGIVYLLLGFLTLCFWNWIALLIGALLFIADGIVFLISLFSALSQPGVTFAPNFTFCFGLVFRLALIVALISSVFAMKDLHDDRRIEQKRIKTTPFALPTEVRRRT
jgi:hypothetical protein